MLHAMDSLLDIDSSHSATVAGCQCQNQWVERIRRNSGNAPRACQGGQLRFRGGERRIFEL
jgi:hypothetical protein